MSVAVSVTKRLTEAEELELDAFIKRDPHNWNSHNKELLSKACNSYVHIKGFLIDGQYRLD